MIFFKHFSIGKAWLIGLVVLLCTLQVSAANAVNYKGKAFWVAFLKSEVGPDPFELSIHITAEVRTTVKFKLKAAIIDSRSEKDWEQSFEVYPGTVTNITIPQEYTLNSKTGKSTHKGLYIEATEDIMVVAKNSSGSSSDATIVLPIASLGTQYYIMQYHVLEAKYPSQYLVLATEDSTEVELTNTATSFDAPKANTPYTVLLNKGDYYMVQAKKDLTGSSIVAKKGKKIAVFSGVTCAYVPKYCQSCDHLYEQMLPIDNWGHQFALVPFDTRKKYVVRILAKEDNTYVDVNGKRQVITHAGKYLELEVKEAFSVTTSRPVMVCQYTIGTHCDEKRGDPSMVVVKPLMSFKGNMEFPGMNTPNIDRYFATVVVNADDVANFRVNGKTHSSNFKPLPYRNEYMYAHIEVNNGSNTIECNCSYNFISYGLGWYESYAY